jgi:outer membrane protein assembly factor BamB
LIAKKVIIYFLLPVFLLVLVAGCLPAGCKTSLSARNYCVVLYVEGTVYRESADGKSRVSLEIGDRLPSTAILVTEKGSVVELEYSDKSRIRLQESTRIQILQVLNRSVEEQTSIRVDMGQVFAELQEGIDETDYVVETDSIIINVDGARFVVTVDENAVSKVAVKEGSVTYSNRIKQEDLDAIIEIDPDFARRISDILVEEITIGEDEQVVIEKQQAEQLSRDLEMITADLRDLVNKYPDESNELALGLDELEKDASIIRDASALYGVEEVSQADWDTVYAESEFNRLNSDSLDDKKYVAINRPRLFIPVTRKLSAGNKIRLTIKNTTVTTGGGLIMVSSTSNKSVYAIDPGSGKTVWTFSDSYMNSIYSSAYYSTGKYIIGTPDMLYVVDRSGNTLIRKPLERGVNFWAEPVEHGGILYIPTSSSLMTWDGTDIGVKKEFGSARGQLYTTAYSSILYSVDINSRNMSAFDLVKGEMSGVSQPFKGGVYTKPVITGGFIFLVDINGIWYRYPLDNVTVSPGLLQTKAGVVSNVVVYNNALYFVANDGNLYRLDAFTFKETVKLASIERDADSDTMITRHLLLHDDELYFASDRGSLYIYTPASGTGLFVDLDSSTGKPLVGSPVVIGDAVYVVDSDLAVYKRYYIEKN